MSRTLRGAWSRRGTLLPLLLLTVVVVAGVVAVTGLAEASETSLAVLVPLLVLGLVALPSTGRQLAAVRRQEIAMARLRGITGGQLYAVLSLEPLLVLVAGALAGVAVGGAVIAVAAGSWNGVGEASVGVTALPPVAAVLVAALAAVLVGMARALREPLADQVSVQERPRPASTAALFGSALMIVAAVVASYRSAVADADDPGWVVLAGPALVGLAVGQIAVWAVRLLARVGVVWTADRGLRGFLASRRLARVAEAATSIRLVVAAAAIAAVALTGAQQVDDWTSDTARLRAGAPYQVPLATDAGDALRLTHRLDPDGEWLMAAVLVPGEGSVPARRVFLEVDRLPAVVGDFYEGTDAAEVRRHVGELVAENTMLVGNGPVEVGVRGVSSRPSLPLRPRVTITYLNDSGRTQELEVRLDVGLDGGSDRARATLDDCAAGCAVTGLVLARSPGDAARPFVLDTLRLGQLDVLTRGWRPEFIRQPAGVVPLEITAVDDGLLVPPAAQPLRTFAEDASPPIPVLVSDSVSWGEQEPLVDSPGGDERPAAVLASLPALPLVEADGLLADLASANAGAPPTVPAAEVMVLAAATTPADLLASLGEQAGVEPVPLAEFEDAIALETGAVRAGLYALMAGFCLLVAVLVLASEASRQGAVHRRETAALRIVGVDLASLRGSGRRELGALALAALAATALGALAGVVLLLRNLALVDVPLHSAPLRIDVSGAPLLASALAAALIVLVVGGRSRVVRSDRGRPAILREES